MMTRAFPKPLRISKLYYNSSEFRAVVEVELVTLADKRSWIVFECTVNGDTPITNTSIIQ